MNRKNNFLLIMGVCICLSACGSPNVVKKAVPPAATGYIIGPEDMLNIWVWKQPDISMSVPVRSDGKISLPLINDIQAEGFTPHQLKDNIAQELSRYIEEPTVSVIVDEINSVKIYLSGNVQTPGMYPIGGRITLIQAITLAGGLNDWADRKNIKIFRGGHAQNIDKINYDAIVDGKDPRQNVFVYPGDTIVVP